MVIAQCPTQLVFDNDGIVEAQIRTFLDAQDGRVWYCSPLEIYKMVEHLNK